MGATHHGRQPALKTGMMWMANVVGETNVNEEAQVSPLRIPEQVIDDPISALEQTAGDLRVAYRDKDVSSILTQLGLFLYYTMLMATSMQLDPYLFIVIWDMPKAWRSRMDLPLCLKMAAACPMTVRSRTRLTWC